VGIEKWLVNFGGFLEYCSGACEKLDSNSVPYKIAQKSAREKIKDEYYLGNGHWSAAEFAYPYSDYGSVFIITGVALTVVALLLSEKKEELG